MIRFFSTEVIIDNVFDFFFLQLTAVLLEEVGNSKAGNYTDVKFLLY